MILLTAGIRKRGNDHTETDLFCDGPPAEVGGAVAVEGLAEERVEGSC